MTNIAELITHILKQPEELGRLVGFKDDQRGGRLHAAGPPGIL